MDFSLELYGIATRVVGFPYENPLRSSAIEATNCDRDFADYKEKPSSSLV